MFERAGNFANGSITGFFTVLVEGDDFNEPICDAVRAILDGHIILSRELGAMGHYPAIDVLNSVSRLASRVATPEQREAARKVREALAAYQQSEDLINLGAYAAGSNPTLDAAIRLRPAAAGISAPGAGCGGTAGSRRSSSCTHCAQADVARRHMKQFAFRTRHACWTGAARRLAWRE